MKPRLFLVVAVVAASTATLLAPAVVLAAAPIAVNDAYSITEDTARIVPRGNGVLKNDTNALSATRLSDPSHGTLAFQSNGGFTYTPAADFFGTDSFTYQAENADGSSLPATVTLTVAPVNDPPSGTLDTSTAMVAEDSGPASMAGRVTDISSGPGESDPITFNVVAADAALFSSQPAIDPAGTLTFTLAANVNGSTSVSVSISDGIAAPVALGSFDIQITAVPDVPIADDDSYTTVEGQTLVEAAPGVLLGDTDADAGTTLTAVKDTDPSHGSLTLNSNGSLTYVPDEGYSGADSFTYHASDGSLDSNVATVSITISEVNDPPVTVPDSATTDEDTQLTVSAPGVLGNDTDPEGQPLSAALGTGPAHGTLELAATGGYTYTPIANYNGPDSFTYRAFDGVVYSAVTTVSLTVTAVPDAPVAVADSYSTSEDTALIVTAPGVLANDSDGDGTTPTAIKDSDPAHGTLTLNADGSFTYTPTANYNGPDSFTYHATDGSLISGTATVSLTITAVNDPPVTVADSGTTGEDTVLTVAAPGVLGNDADPEGLALTAVLGTGPAHGTLELAATGGYTYTPSANYNGPDSFTYRASDGGVQSVLTTVSLTVTPVPDAPVAVADAATTNEDTPLVVAAPGVKANDSDVDSTAAQVVASLVAQALHGTAVVNANGSYSYTPIANYHGPDGFTYHLTDETALVSATVTVSLTVVSVNDVPAVVGDAYTTNEDVVLVVPATGVLGNDTDADGDPLAATVVANPTKGTVALASGGGFTYTPNADANGSDSFTYHATDGQGGTSATATVSLTIRAVNDPPTFTLGPDQTVAESSSLETVTGFLTAVSPGPADESGQTTSSPQTVATSPELFVDQPMISASGTLTFRPYPFRSGSSLVTVTIDDDGGVANGGNDSGVRTFVITVTGTNDPVYANSDSWMLDDDPPAWIEAGITTPLDVLANDISPDIGEVLTIMSTTKPGHGTVTIAADKRSLSYRSTTGYSGSDSFKYTMTDGVYSSSATVSMSIRDTRPPTLGTQSFRFRTGAKMTSTVPVRLGWSASDPGSGVKSYDVQQSTNGGASWTTIYSGTTATSATRSLAFRTPYSYRFRARDKGNRTSAWSAWTTFTPTRDQEWTSSATYSSGWKRATISSASGGHTRYTTARGATSTFSFTGRAVSLVAPRSASRGKAQIRVDGALVATIDLYHSTTQARRHVWSSSWGSVGAHVVTVTVLRTSGHPRFDIDAWTVLR